VATTGLGLASLSLLIHLAACHLRNHIVLVPAIKTYSTQRSARRLPPPYASTPNPSPSSLTRFLATTCIPVSKTATTMKQAVARKARPAMTSLTYHRLKYRVKILSGVRKIRMPVHTMPMICKAMMASMIALSWPPAFPSLLGKFRAEKSRAVFPSWMVEFV
jgi:hypothetical protein